MKQSQSSLLNQMNEMQNIEYENLSQIKQI
jgi:hypothetical protein